MRVLVTGASGFIGQGLCELLWASGHKVGPVTRRSGAQWQINALDGWTDWSTILSAFRPEAIVHCAARVHVLKETENDTSSIFRRVNVDGTLHLARQAQAFGVRRFVFVSSVKVNGETSALGLPFVETDDPAPVDPYGISKLEAELALAVFARESGLEVVTVRPPLVYGLGVGANFRLLVRLVERGLPLPFASVDNRRSYVSRSNLCNFLLTCLEHPAAVGGTFLISDDHDLSLPETIRMIASAVGRPARLVPVPERVLKVLLGAVGHSEMYDKLCGSLQVSPAHAATVLGWRPPCTVRQGFADIAGNDNLPVVVK